MAQYRYALYLNDIEVGYRQGTMRVTDEKRAPFCSFELNGTTTPLVGQSVRLLLWSLLPDVRLFSGEITRVTKKYDEQVAFWSVECQSAEFRLNKVYPCIRYTSTSATTVVAGLMALAATYYRDTVLEDTPSGYWRLGELAGVTAADTSGNARSGTYTASYTLGVTGIQGDQTNKGIEVDNLGGTGGYVDLGVVSAFCPTGGSPFTVEAWVSPRKQFVNAAPYEVFGNEVLNASGLLLRLESNDPVTPTAGRIHCEMSTAGASTSLDSSYSAAINIGLMSHVVWTYDGTNSRLYLNGALIAGPSAMTSPVAATISTRIGRATTGASRFQGVLDEVAFYPAALSATRVTAHWQAGAVNAIVTANHVEAALPSISVFFDGSQPLGACLDEVCSLIGGSRYVDYYDDLHLFVTAETGDTPAALDERNRDLLLGSLIYSEDLTQIRNRINVRGAARKVMAEIAAGGTSIPVEDSSIFSSGSVIHDDQVIAYSGKQAGETASTVSGLAWTAGTLSAAVVSNTAGRIAAGAYLYKKSCVTATGESGLGAATSTATISAVSAPSAPTPVDSTTVSGRMATGQYYYGVAYGTENGQTLIGSTAADTITDVASPSSVSPSTGTGGGMTPSVTYYYAYTVVTANGESASLGSGSFGMGGSDTKVTWSTSCSDGRILKVRIYRAVPGTSTPLFLACECVPSGSTDDTLPDTSLSGSVIPSASTHNGGTMTVTIPTSGDGRVTSRYIYRSKVGTSSPLYLVATIGNNSATSLVDNKADSELSDLSLAVSTADNGKINLSSITSGASGTIAHKIWRTKAGGSDYYLLTTINGNSPSTYADDTPDTSLGALAPTESLIGHPVGSTTLNVKDLAQFPSSGWARVGSQILSYTGRSAGSGEGNLTGIPSSGVGSLLSDIRFGTQVVAQPSLTGVTGIVKTIPTGDRVALWVVRNSTASQALMRTREGGNGIHVFPVYDDSLTSLTACQARGDAEWTLYANPIVSCVYQTRDPKSRSGKYIVVNFEGLSATLLIQRVELSQAGMLDLVPLYSVTASSVLFTLNSLLSGAMK